MTDPTHVPTRVAQANGIDVDELVEKWAEKLQDIYDLQTAGDFTFFGVLAQFLQELDGR